MQQKEIEKLNKMSNAVRFLSVDMITKAKSGHPGLPMGCAELATVLFAKHLRFSPNNPKWINRDRFVLSAGHGSALLYSLLYLSGYNDITLDDIKNFRQFGSPTAGHPEFGNLAGIETTTGPLGQGIATATGLALGEKIRHARNNTTCDNKVYVLAGDGCLMEGVSEEAISIASTLNLNNLIVLWDDNNITIDGNATIANTVDMKARFASNGWQIFEVKNGYDVDELDSVLTSARTATKPVFVDIHTIIGHGYAPVENTSGIHGSPLKPEQIVEAKATAGYPTEPFAIPSEILDDWKVAGSRNNAIAQNDKSDSSDISNIDLAKLSNVIQQLKSDFITENKPSATRASDGKVLEALQGTFPNLIGGTADLATPTVTKNKNSKTITRNDYNGNFIEYGIREHGMASATNGLALCGFRAFCSTFFCFADYLKPALRLSALMHLPTIHILTHDSVFLGEDGPTHQPIEHLASLRSIPNLTTIRPADSVEVAEAWDIALRSQTKPTAIILSRQATPIIRQDSGDTLCENKTAHGAYIIHDFAPDLPHHITIIATGTEIATAITVQTLLRDQHQINARVVSMPSMDLFDKQSDDYRNSVIPDDTITVSIEAGSTFGWAKYADINIGIDTFGTSAPEAKIREHFGFTPEQLTERIITEISED